MGRDGLGAWLLGNVQNHKQGVWYRVTAFVLDLWTLNADELIM